jgi:thioredoxin reductase
MIQRRDFVKDISLLIGGWTIPLPIRPMPQPMNNDTLYDVIIVGGSYAGLAAAMALGRAMRNVLVIDGGKPCNWQTPRSHNFLTHDGKPPGEIAALARAQVRMYPTVTLIDGYVSTARQTPEGFTLGLRTGDTFHARKLIFATGISDVMPDIPGFAACWGISALHCPYCHGYEVRGNKTGILANGDAAFELASLIQHWTQDLTVYTNGESTLTDPQSAKLREHGIRIVDKPITLLAHNQGHLEHIHFRDGTLEPVQTLYARLPFVQHSSLPQDLGCTLSADGYIDIDAAHRTSLPGVYACGDNVTRMRTVANAVAMGTTTGMMVNKELIGQAFLP